jgi:hypothetical protein
MAAYDISFLGKTAQSVRVLSRGSSNTASRLVLQLGNAPPEGLAAAEYYVAGREAATDVWHIQHEESCYEHPYCSYVP